MVLKKNYPRSLIITANWKMHKTISGALQFVETLAPLFGTSQGNSRSLNHVEIYIAPPFTAIAPLSDYVRKKGLPFTIGAQNMHEEIEGAFTGEISASMLKEAGARFVIIGHSERRKFFHETNSTICKKIHTALATQLKVTLCIGEDEEEREKGQTEKVLAIQLDEGLKGIPREEMGNIILSYEPVWAIGTGKVATADQAEQAQKFCRDFIASKWGKEAALEMIIQYGGSVKPDNAQKLVEEIDVDGLLIGGASLDAKVFSQILIGCEKSAILKKSA
jgi:triosephosphate isomerase (TIM)